MRLLNDDFSVEELICNESFQQYCLGLSLENQILWKEWISTVPERAADLEEAKKIVFILSAKQGNRLQQLEELNSGIKQRDFLSSKLFLTKDSKIAAVPKHKSRWLRQNRRYQYIGGVAAALIILLGSFYFLRYNRSSVSDFQLSSGLLLGKSFSSGSALRKTVILSDGSVITLNKQSTIRLIQNFDVSKRELWLSGEAFFDVKHDHLHPFIVHTSFNDIKVLGTVFNVKAPDGAKFMETSLIRGSVKVESKKYPGHTVLLKPDEKLVAINSSQKETGYTAHVFEVYKIKRESLGQKPEEIQWVRNRLHIENEPLSAIVKKLQNWYGIEIIITDDQVKNYSYSGTFENETILKTLEALQLSYHFEFKTEQDKIIISK